MTTAFNEMEKIVSIKDGDHDVEVKILKMGALQAYRWSLDFITLLCRAGIPIPKGALNNVEAAGREIAKALESNAIFQLPGLNSKDLFSLLSELHKYAYFVAKNEDGGGQRFIEVRENNINAHFKNPFSVFRLEMEVAIYALGFSKLGDRLFSKIDEAL